MVKRSGHKAPLPKLPRLTNEMRQAVITGAAQKELVIKPDKRVYIKGQDEPICSALTMLRLCEMGWFRPLTENKGTITIRMTDVGYGIERDLRARKPKAAD